MDLEHSELLNDWDKWKATLAKTVNVGQAIGLSQESIKKIGVKIGDFLSASVDPENREHRLLKELWTVGDDREREVLTGLIVKMVETGNMH